MNWPKAAPRAAAICLRFLIIRAGLDYSKLEPGEQATDAIRKAAVDLDFAGKYQARLRLTGPVPMADEEFATIKENAGVNASVTIAIVLVILWLALRWFRVIFAVFACLVVGLSITAAVGLVMVGTLNLISVYFAVLFVGLGVDFGLQFSVRYRAERHEVDDVRGALLQAARRAGAPLTLAALATAAGFLSFLPTVYKGVSELGLIAGFGMLIAFATSITLLPALLSLLKPPPEPVQLGYAVLAPVDDFLARHRVADPDRHRPRGRRRIAAALLAALRFQSDQSAQPQGRIGRDLSRADQGSGKRRQRYPGPDAVARCRRRDGGETARPAAGGARGHAVELHSGRSAAKAAADRERGEDAGARAQSGGIEPAADRCAKRQHDEFDHRLPQPARRHRARSAARLRRGGWRRRWRRSPRRILPCGSAPRRSSCSRLRTALDDLRDLFKAQEVTRDNMPPSLAAAMGDAGRPSARRGRAVGRRQQQCEAQRLCRRRPVGRARPRPRGRYRSSRRARAIVFAFIEAGVCALLSIGIILLITLRRISDVLLTLVPLLLAGVVTLEICVLVGLPLNFANIIALPLLLGVGVAFKIYYIMAWREGQTNLLQSVLTRAVTFSACTTATAFGSLWFSSHPGTSSMGKLLAISLLTTMAAAALFQPILMGKPRQQEPAEAAQSVTAPSDSLLRRLVRRRGLAGGGGGHVGIDRRIELAEGRIRQPRPILVLSQHFDANIAAHDQRLAVRRDFHRRVIDFAVTRIEDRAAAVFVFAFLLHAADDFEPEPGMIVAIVLALVADELGSSPGLKNILAMMPS